MNPYMLDATYVTSAKGRIFVTFRQPAQAARSSVLFVPPFAEEMNKSRRMFTELGEALAERGIASFLPDLYGTGDSEGDFADGDWRTWCSDLSNAAVWAARHLGAVNSMVAARLGAELAADAVEAGILPGFERSVLWQPVFDRNRFLTQFLRLRSAAALGRENHRESVEDLKQELRVGKSIEVAGYELSGALGKSFVDTESRTALPEGCGSIHWLEIQRATDTPLATPSLKVIETTQGRGMTVKPIAMTGEPFWVSTEIVTVRSMIEHTVEVLAS